MALAICSATVASTFCVEKLASGAASNASSRLIGALSLPCPVCNSSAATAGVPESCCIPAASRTDTQAVYDAVVAHFGDDMLNADRTVHRAALADVVFADEFLKVFDGYSIGSNDLTQLALGLDRDSEMVAHLFDERNGAVEKMVAMAIDSAIRNKKKIGICGQAPSDYPEFAEFLVKKGINSISLRRSSRVR